MSSEELLDVVDTNDNVISTATKTVCHRDGLLHRVAHFTLVDRKLKKILLAKQPASKFSDVGSSVFLGGHVTSGESYEECLKREIQEELGIECTEYIEIGCHIFEYDGKREIAKCYLVSWFGQDLCCDTNEMDDVWWVSVSELVKERKNIGQITGYWVDHYDWKNLFDNNPID